MIEIRQLEVPLPGGVSLHEHLTIDNLGFLPMAGILFCRVELLRISGGEVGRRRLSESPGGPQVAADLSSSAQPDLGTDRIPATRRDPMCARFDMLVHFGVKVELALLWKSSGAWLA